MEGVRYVSHSEFKTFRECRRLWWLTYVRRLVTRTEDTGALSLGVLTHLGLETLSEGGDLDLAREVIRQTALSAHVEPDRMEAWLTQAAQAQGFVEGYVEWLEQSGADQRYEHVASEQELETDLAVIDGVRWKLIGKLDRRVHDKQTGFDRFMDFKTCASFDQFIKDVPRNEQFPTYELLLRAETDERTGGGVWRMIKKSKRARDGDGEFFRDYEASFNDRFLNSVWDRYVGIAHDMAECERRLLAGESHHMVVYPTPTFNCSWKCPFAIVCDMFDDGSRVEDAVSVLYRERDPYERYTEIRERD